MIWTRNLVLHSALIVSSQSNILNFDTLLTIHMASPLATVGNKICRLLDELTLEDVGGAAGPEDAYYIRLVLNEGDRFKIWLIDSGLFELAHGSLDHRIRGAVGFTKVLSTFLRDLEEAIEERTS